MNNGKTFFDYDVGKAFAGFNFPGFDVDGLIAAQRKNFEAFTQANQLAVEGVQALAKRQVEIATAAIEEAQAALKDLTAPGGAEEKLAKNTELAKASYEKALAATRELVRPHRQDQRRRVRRAQQALHRELRRDQEFRREEVVPHFLRARVGSPLKESRSRSHQA